MAGPSSEPNQTPISTTTATPPATTSSKQPTYTTAGTLYNPSSTQPLQAPARRGRSAKWNGLANADLCLFPKASLAGLTMKAAAGARLAAIQQYTPLQQNYDRAVSPLSDQDQAAAPDVLPPQTLQVRSGNTPTSTPTPTPAPAPAPRPLALPNLADETEPVKGQSAQSALGPGSDPESDDGADEEEDDQDTLPNLWSMGLSFKSISNLASYPNPTQKSAQKLCSAVARTTLAAGRAPVGHASSPVSLAPQPDRGSDTSNVPPSLLRIADLHVAPNRERAAAAAAAAASLLPPAPSPSLLCKEERGADDAVPVTLAAGPGAPRPLTAGPPGQRQYRPSTFESTFKALQPQGHPQPRTRTLDLFEPDAQGPVMHFALDESDGPSADLDGSSSLSINVGRVARPNSLLAKLVAESEPELASPYPRASLFGRKGPVAAWNRSADVSYTCWRTSSYLCRERNRPATRRLTPDALEARRERMDSYWYAGSALMAKTQEEVIAESAFRRLQHSYGVIGDGRPVRNTKTEYRPLTMEEATRTSVTDHAEPLLNMVFATIVRHAEEKAVNSPFRQFGTPPPESCDATPVGNSSFFS
ncbi:hypothetical protein RJ55_05991 [Drechmeria coniospora]|nr:hypothetical protein RJ55_05991 [Drechmeria coniospora]